MVNDRTSTSHALPLGRLFTVLLLAVVSATGCTTVSETYEGRSPDQVWTAMKAVAESPRYDEWIVTDNDVTVYETDRRIEIHRRLRRDVVIPGVEPQREAREYDQTYRLVEDDDGPTIKFKGQDWEVPARARDEAKRFFADVWEILGGRDDEADEMDADDAVDADADAGLDVTTP